MSRPKLLLLSDDLRAPSGVGTQSHHLAFGLVEKGWDIVQVAGLIKPPSLDPVQLTPNIKLYPYNGYGDMHMIRQLLETEKPDAVMMFTDPRFFYWAWDMENEIRSRCPLVYWHVWDNWPYPDYNELYYRSTDFIGCLAYNTFEILRDGGKLEQPNHIDYIPHGLPLDLYKILPEEQNKHFAKQSLSGHENNFKVFWNNRNARRKMTGDVLESFKFFLDMLPNEERNKCTLVMHTNPRDEEGTDIGAVANMLGIPDKLIVSEEKVPFENMVMAYNCMDVTINIANNEGFGLATLESLACGVPIIVNMTGGLKVQPTNKWNEDDVRDHGEEWYGIGLEPDVRNLAGSLPTPYIYDDRVNNHKVARAIYDMWEMGSEKRKELGQKGRKYIERNFDMTDQVIKWDEALKRTIKSTKNNKTWSVTRV